MSMPIEPTLPKAPNARDVAARIANSLDNDLTEWPEGLIGYEQHCRISDVIGYLKGVAAERWTVGKDRVFENLLHVVRSIETTTVDQEIKKAAIFKLCDYTTQLAGFGISISERDLGVEKNLSRRV